MATVGNLFVNVSANTGGLASGLNKAKKQVDGFANSAKGTSSLMSSMFPSMGILDGVTSKIGKIAEAFKAMNAGAMKAAEATKAVAQAQHALDSAKGARKNIGVARADLIKRGFSPENDFKGSLQKTSVESVAKLKGAATAASASVQQLRQSLTA